MTCLSSAVAWLLLFPFTLFVHHPTCVQLSGHFISVKQTSNANALLELRKAVGSVAMVASAKGKAVAFQQAVFRNKPLSEVSFGSDGVSVVWPNKRRVIFHNVHPHAVADESEVVTHHYMGTESLTGLVWITKELYEDNKQLLISQTNDKVTEVANEPHINRIGTLLFAKQNECYQMFDDCYPGFQLWRINKGTLKLIKEVRLKDYFVVKDGWISTSTVRMEVASLQDMMDGKKVANMKRQFFDVTVR